MKVATSSWASHISILIPLRQNINIKVTFFGYSHRRVVDKHCKCPQRTIFCISLPKLSLIENHSFVYSLVSFFYGLLVEAPSRYYLLLSRPSLSMSMLQSAFSDRSPNVWYRVPLVVVPASDIDQLSATLVSKVCVIGMPTTERNLFLSGRVPLRSRRGPWFLHNSLTYLKKPMNSQP